MSVKWLCTNTVQLIPFASQPLGATFPVLHPTPSALPWDFARQTFVLCSPGPQLFQRYHRTAKNRRTGEAPEVFGNITPPRSAPSRRSLNIWPKSTGARGCLTPCAQPEGKRCQTSAGRETQNQGGEHGAHREVVAVGFVAFLRSVSCVAQKKYDPPPPPPEIMGTPYKEPYNGTTSGTPREAPTSHVGALEGRDN